MRSTVLGPDFLEVRHELRKIFEVCPVGVHLFHRRIDVDGLLKVHGASFDAEDLPEGFVDDGSGQKRCAAHGTHPAQWAAISQTAEHSSAPDRSGSHTKRGIPALLGEFRLCPPVHAALQARFADRFLVDFEAADHLCDARYGTYAVEKVVEFVLEHRTLQNDKAAWLDMHFDRMRMAYRVPEGSSDALPEYGVIHFAPPT